MYLNPRDSNHAERKKISMKYMTSSQWERNRDNAYTILLPNIFQPDCNNFYTYETIEDVVSYRYSCSTETNFESVLIQSYF